MNRILSLLALGMLGACATAAQTTASGQAGASGQSQASMQTNNSGAQTSGSSSAATSSSSMSTNSNAGSSSASLSNGTKINASLASSLDAKRSKPGDEVEARTEEDIKQDGKVVMKKGTRLVGHVTQAQAKANGQSQSQLGIMFDHAVLKNGQDVPFNASIQALASSQSAAAASTGSDNVMDAGNAMGSAQGSARNGGLISGAASTAGSATGTVMNTASSAPTAASGSLSTVNRSSGAIGGLNSAGRLSSNSSGVFGLEGISLDSAASNTTQGSMIVSSTKNVHLDSGTQLLLQTTGQAQ